jgi:hypothetical protein
MILWPNLVNLAMLSLRTWVLLISQFFFSPRLPIPQLNPNVNPFQRSFVGEIRRIEEMARRVRFFATQIEREHDPIPTRPLYDSAPLIAVGPRAAQTMDDLDVTLGEHESRLLEMNSAYEVLSERLAELIEARHVLLETAVFFRRVSVLCGCCILGRNISISLFRSNRLRARSARLLMTVLFPYSNMTIAKTSTRLRQMSSSTSSMWLPRYLAIQSL